MCSKSGEKKPDEEQKSWLTMLITSSVFILVWGLLLKSAPRTTFEQSIAQVPEHRWPHTKN